VRHDTPRRAGVFLSTNARRPVTRRGFLEQSVPALAALAVAPAKAAVHARRPAHDLVVRGGMLFDGTGAAGVEQDLAIDGDRIVAVAPRIAERGAEEIDARGLAVAPGFVDIHSHADGSLDEDPRAESVVRQGVTTIVAGQDGSSRYPGEEGPKSWAEYVASLDRLGAAVNVASMVGLGSVRGAVMGNVDRPATPNELARMTALVAEAVAGGAGGA
jgi:N-acyl-D-amino-acid deacylase